MKKETTGKKSKLGLIIAIALVAVLAVVGVVLALTLGGNEPAPTPDEGNTPTTVTSKLYWNIDRLSMVDEETGLSTRQPGQDGLYHIRFAVDGQQVELSCADKKLVTRIDLKDVVGLAFDADGLIVDVYDAKDVATLIQDRTFVQNFDGKKLTTNSSIALNGMEQTIELPEDAKIYIVESPRPEVPGRDFTVGAEDTLKLMDTVLIYGSDENTPHTVYVMDRLYESKVYWRTEAGQYNSTSKASTRPLADDGYWYMEFFVEGEFVTLRTKDQACINVLDAKSVVNAATGLVFNHEGDIVDVFNAGYAVRGSISVNNYDVTAIEGNMVTLTRKLAGNEQGRTYTLTYNDTIPVYNMTTTADKLGELTDIREGDRLLILSDATGKPVQIYLTCRLVDSPMYYNISQSYNTTTKETGRKPDADGWYTVKLAVKGKEKEYRTKNKALMTQIDSYGNRVFGLKVSGDVIKKVYNPECVTGAYSFAANNWVTSVSGSIVGTVTSTGTAVNGIMDSNCEVYDVSGCSSHIGAKATLREGDRIVAYNTPDATMRYVYITSRKVSGVSLYWNLDKTQYNSVTQETTRKPNEEGYYVYTNLAKAGKAGLTELKTKDAKLAAKIDKNGNYALCLKVKNGIITGVYPATAINAGYSRIFGIYTTQQTDDTHYGAMFYTTGATANIDISEAKIYNVSGVYKKGAGENTKLQPNDRLMLLYGQSGKAEHIFVYERESGSPAYWQFNPNFNSSPKTTEPDADGYYNYTVTVGGKIKNVKTKDAEIAAYMDTRTLAFGMKLKGDIIVGAYNAASTKEIAASGASYYDVTKIKGNKITLTRTTPGSSNTGDVKEINISKAKVYNVSAYAGSAWGKTAKLGIGDRVQTYVNEQNETTLVYIVWENTREAGHKSYCEHCKQEVYWHPYYGTIDFIDKHYYLPADFQAYYSKGWGIQGRASGWDWVLDLNGFTYEATGSYAFAVRGNSKLTVVDTSKAKTGRITGYGVQAKDAEGNPLPYQAAAGAIFSVLDNGTLNLRGGTYTRSVNHELTSLRRAGVAIVSETGTLNIYDGAKLVNNTMDVPLDLATDGVTEVRRAPQGGAIYNNGGVVNIYGGLISGNGKIHEDYKEFEKAVGNGGNIFVAAGELNIYGGKITNGWCVGNGGNIFMYGGKLNIAGGEISGGTSVNGADNIIASDNKGVEVNITGGKITGDVLIGTGNTLKISGNPVISMGNEQGLYLGEGVKAKVGTMKNGAKIVLSSTGVFTTDFATKEAAEAILAKNYFVGESSLTPFYVEGKALACGKKMCLNGHTNKDQCDAANCDKELLSWNPWTATDSLPTTGNYYLTQNVTVDSGVTVSGSMVLDLNGFNVTRTATEDQVKAGSQPVFTAAAGTKLVIADLSGKSVPGTVKVVLPKDADDKIVPVNGTTGIISVATGSEVEIYGGIFDGKDMLSSSANAGGIFCGGGKLTIHDGTFYGWSNKDGASGGIGSVFGGWSTSVVTVNGGTFYGGKVKQGGMFATNGKLLINGGVFNGNNSATNAIIDNTKPRTEATHGGLIYAIDHANSYVEINGGIFTAPRTYNSGGIIYTDANAGSKTVLKITGGTFNLSKAGNGGFIRFRGKSLDITGVTLTGATATTGDIINMNSAGTLTIGKDAVIGGGIELSAAAKLVLKDNVNIDAGTNYAIKLGTGTLDLSGLNDQAKVHINYTDTTKAFYEAADEETAKKLVDNKIIVSGDPNYRVIADGKALKVKVQIQWQEWNAAAAATVYGGAEADNLHLTKLPKEGNWKLTSDVTVTSRTAMTGNLNLNLNGFTVTRKLTATDNSNGIYTTNGKGNLYITDEIKLTDPTKSVGTMKAEFDTGVTTTTGVGHMGYVGAGCSITIDEGIFDFRGVRTTSTAGTGTGAIIVDGTLTINGGTFYGTNCGTTGFGTVIGGRSAGIITINGGTFYGNNAKQGGIISSTGNLTINGGLFDGNTNASNGKVDSTLPQTVVTHGGLFYVAKTLTITGGEFKAARVSGSGGIAYVVGSNSVISGGTYTAAGTVNYGGFFRFDGSATVSGVTLSGGRAATNGNNISFGSAGNATLTIGQDAVIDGGIMFRNDKTGNKLVLMGNAKVNASDAAKYSLNLANATVHIGSLSNAAVVTVGATLTDYIATYDAGNVTGVQAAN